MKTLIALALATLSSTTAVALQSEPDHMRINVSYQDTRNHLVAGGFSTTGESRQPMAVSAGYSPDDLGSPVGTRPGLSTAITMTFGPRPQGEAQDPIAVDLDWSFTTAPTSFIESIFTPSAPGAPQYVVHRDRRTSVLNVPGTISYKSGPYLITLSVERPKPVIRLTEDQAKSAHQ